MNDIVGESRLGRTGLEVQIIVITGRQGRAGGGEQGNGDTHYRGACREPFHFQLSNYHVAR